MAGNRIESVLGEWAIEFSKRVAERFCFRPPRYSEMRSSSLRS